VATKAEKTALAEEIVILGARPHPLRDLYHALLRARGSMVVLFIVVVFLVINAVFALGYLVVGGVAHVRPGSFLDAYAFSVQTMATIGYGAMYPEESAAQFLVITEAVVSLLVNALATGLIFAKFSQPTSALVFSEKVAIAPMNGVPTLSFRIGNDRANSILEATIRVSIVRTERTSEGVLFYRMYDLDLVRDRSPALARSWTVLHHLTPDSPLHGSSPERCVQDEIEIVATVVGTDDTSLQPVHGRHRYLTGDIVWGARHADILSERPDGTIVLDIRHFDTLTPAEPTPDFPYRWQPPGVSR
jgi:inward rectifier potassium channel